MEQSWFLFSQQIELKIYVLTNFPYTLPHFTGQSEICDVKIRRKNKTYRFQWRRKMLLIYSSLADHRCGLSFSCFFYRPIHALNILQFRLFSSLDFLRCGLWHYCLQAICSKQPQYLSRGYRTNTTSVSCLARSHAQAQFCRFESALADEACS